MRLKRMILTVIIFINGTLPAFAKNSSELSFVPFQACKKSPVSPPSKLFRKAYKTYINPGPWAIFDINGDGWCDWVGSGNEGYRSDQEYPPMREFIYLGTVNGWRHFDQPKVKHREMEAWEEGKLIMIASNYAALNFVEPIPIYSKGEAKPYVISVIRYDAPAPPPESEKINVFRWRDDLDKLYKVTEDERIMVINFLHDTLCKYPPDLITVDGSPFLLAQGDLCFPRK